ncbi:MAG: aminoacyl-tRNA hydrolase [Deltaproteobacteria bacterium]|nr:aminoacyl-tRNA hydrolase [Deltaproteobacteria bacterium]
MEENLYVCEGVVIPGAELSVVASRSGGPGGQNVNKVATRITLRWNALASVALDAGRRQRLAEKLASRLTVGGEIVIHADEHRSQHMNRESARARLAAMILDALTVAPDRIPTRPSRGAKRRRLAGKKLRSEVKRGRRTPADDD